MKKSKHKMEDQTSNKDDQLTTILDGLSILTSLYESLHQEQEIQGRFQLKIYKKLSILIEKFDAASDDADKTLGLMDENSLLGKILGSIEIEDKTSNLDYDERNAAEDKARHGG